MYYKQYADSDTDSLVKNPPKPPANIRSRYSNACLKIQQSERIPQSASPTAPFDKGAKAHI